MVIAIQKTYSLTMNNYKNLLIAVLTGLLGLSLFTQPAQSAPTSKSKEAKMIEYARCLELAPAEYLDQDRWITGCAKYRP